MTSDCTTGTPTEPGQATAQVGSLTGPADSQIAGSGVDETGKANHADVNHRSLDAMTRGIAELNYTDLQLLNIEVFIDQTWDLFELYFPSPDLPSDNPVPVPAPTPVRDHLPTALDYEAERQRFVKAFLAIVASLAWPALRDEFFKRFGERLIEILKTLCDQSSGPTQARYQRVRSDLEIVIARLDKVAQVNGHIRANDLAQSLGGDVALARAWLKKLGWTHRGNCQWHLASSTRLA